MADAEAPRSIVGGSASLMASRLFVGLLSYAATATVARVLTSDDWGAFTFANSMAILAATLFDFQVSRIVLLELMDDERDVGPVVGSLMTLRLLIGLLTYGAVMLFVVATGYDATIVQATAIASIPILLTPTWNGLFLYFQARHWLRSVALVNAISRVLLLALTLGLVVLGVRSLLPFLWPLVICEVFILVTLVAIARRHIHLRPAIDLRKWRAWMKDAITISLGYAIGTLYYRLDTIMLSQLDTLQAVGLYGIGYKFSDLIGYLPVAVLAPVFALLVRAWPDHPAAFARTVRSAWILMIAGAFGFASILTVFAHPLIVLLYGERYGPGAGAARLVILGQAIRFFTTLCVTVLISVHRNRPYVVAALVGLALNIVINLVAIPHYSYSGAAFATVVTELVVLVMLVVALRRVPDIGPFPWSSAWRIVAASAALVAVALGTWLVAPWPVAFVASALTFLATLHLFGIDGEGGLRVVPHLLQPVEAIDDATN